MQKVNNILSYGVKGRFATIPSSFFPQYNKYVKSLAILDELQRRSHSGRRLTFAGSLELATKCHVHRSTVIRHLARLQELGLISLVRRGGSARGIANLWSVARVGYRKLVGNIHPGHKCSTEATHSMTKEGKNSASGSVPVDKPVDNSPPGARERLAKAPEWARERYLNGTLCKV